MNGKVMNDKVLKSVLEMMNLAELGIRFAENDTVGQKNLAFEQGRLTTCKRILEDMGFKLVRKTGFKTTVWSVEK